MNKSTKKLALSALLAAIAVVLLYAASVIPSGRMALAAVAGLCVAATVIECGMPYGVLCFVASALISVFAVPDKSPAAFYIVFLGYYPLLKGIIEKHIFNRVAEWALKLAAFNAAVSLLWAALALGILSIDFNKSYAVPIIYLVGNAVFVIYDIGLSKLIYFYITRISSRIKHK